jgi:hypothetical protein
VMRPDRMTTFPRADLRTPVRLNLNILPLRL